MTMNGRCKLTLKCSLVSETKLTHVETEILTQRYSLGYLEFQMIHVQQTTIELGTIGSCTPPI